MLSVADSGLLLLLLFASAAVAKGDRLAQLVLECIVTPNLQ
jgi:hypothetical protein